MRRLGKMNGWAGVAGALGLCLWVGCASDEDPKAQQVAGKGGDAGQAATSGSAGTGQSGSGSDAARGGQAGSSAQAGTGGTAGAHAGRGSAGGGAGRAGSAGSGAHAGSGGAAGLGGSAGDGTSAGAAGDSGVFDGACPTNGDPCRIMPLGDSITDGCCGGLTESQGGSYRTELFRMAVDHGKNITFVGSLSGGPSTVEDVPFPKNHEGHSGWTIDDGGGRYGLQPPIGQWLSATTPHVVLLMIGTNDVDIQLDLPNAPARLAKLVDTILEDAPNALLVLAQIVPTQSDSENVLVQQYNAAMPDIVDTRAAAGKHIVLVDMYGAYTKDPDYKTNLLANALHPSDAGYATMAQVWWDAIGAVLPSQ